MCIRDRRYGGAAAGSPYFLMKVDRRVPLADGQHLMPAALEVVQDLSLIHIFGLVQAVFGFIVVYSMNRFVKKHFSEGALF